jgi:mannose-6-phosphate isomerase
MLIVLAGTGRLRAGGDGDLELRRGSTVLVPHAAGACDLDGVLDVLRCLPPRPED